MESGTEHLRGTETPAEEQSALGGSSHHRHLRGRAIAILVATAITVVQAIWLVAIAWGLYKTFDWLSERQTTSQAGAPLVEQTLGKRTL